MLLFLEYHFEKEYKLQLNCYSCISFGLSRKTKNWTCVRACVGMFVVSHKVLAFLIVDTDKFPNLWVGSWETQGSQSKALVQIQRPENQETDGVVLFQGWQAEHPGRAQGSV